MKFLLALVLASGIASGATPAQSLGDEGLCDFSSPKDFLSEPFSVFSVHGMRLNFNDNAGFTSHRPFLISRCTSEAGINCFRAAYFSFGVPNAPISRGDTWVIDGENYAYEQDADVKLLGRSERFAVISKSFGGKVKTKFMVNEIRGLAVIMFFDNDGRANYQVYLQGNSCRPFPIRIRSE